MIDGRRIEAYRQRYAMALRTSYPAGYDIQRCRMATADRLKAREPSRAPTDTGSRGKYDPAENRPRVQESTHMPQGGSGW